MTAAVCNFREWPLQQTWYRAHCICTGTTTASPKLHKCLNLFYLLTQRRIKYLFRGRGCTQSSVIPSSFMSSTVFGIKILNFTAVTSLTYSFRTHCIGFGLILINSKFITLIFLFQNIIFLILEMCVVMCDVIYTRD